MKIPVRNYLPTPLTIFIEPYCDQYEVPVGGEALVTLDDDFPFQIDVHPENWVSIWDEGIMRAVVEVFDKRFASTQ